VLTSKYFSADPHIGLEADFKKIIFLRAGLGNFAKIPDFDKEVLTFQPNIGLGLKLWNFTLDYALTDIGDKSIALYSNVFSLRYCFSDFKKK